MKEIIFLLISILLISPILAIEVTINYDISDNMAMGTCYTLIKNLDTNITENISLNCNEKSKTINIDYGDYAIKIVGIDNASNENFAFASFKLMPDTDNSNGNNRGGSGGSGSGSRSGSVSNGEENVKPSKSGVSGGSGGMPNITTKKKEKTNFPFLIFPVLGIFFIILSIFVIRIIKKRNLNLK